MTILANTETSSKSEEDLRVVRDAHHWALATVAMLEGYIEQLRHSVSHGWHMSWERSGSH